MEIKEKNDSLALELEDSKECGSIYRASEKPSGRGA
jgi:hypothetical protein